MLVLEATGIKKQFEDTVVILNDLDLQVSSREIVAILGRSGSGKSTLLQICGLLDNPDSGQLKIAGEDCLTASDYHKTLIRRRKIGFVYQFHHLLSEFNVIENLIIPQLVAGVSAKEATNHALHYLERFDLIAKQTMQAHQLSGGERQRVAIIRSIINKPQVIIADEPTGNLDGLNAALAFKLLKEAVLDCGAGAIIATHNLELAAMCSRVMSLENGVLQCH